MVIVNNDISVFMNFFINMFLDIWQGFWHILEMFQFGGTNLYYIVIIILVLRIGIPIMVQLHNDEKLGSEKIERKRVKYGRRNNND